MLVIYGRAQPKQALLWLINWSRIIVFHLACRAYISLTSNKLAHIQEPLNWIQLSKIKLLLQISHCNLESGKYFCCIQQQNIEYPVMCMCNPYIVQP